MIRPVVLSLALAALALPGAARAQDPIDASCANGAGPKLYVHVTGLMDRGGRLKLELYPGNEADFL